MNRAARFLCLSATALFCWSGPAAAEYTLVLKNGRRIIVQSYREEGGMIKFYDLGGEIGIGRDQIQNILKGREGEKPGTVSPRIEGAPARPVGEPRVDQKKESPIEPRAKISSPEEKLPEERAQDEKEYQNKLKEITAQIKGLGDQYSLATRGTSSTEPGLLDSEEAIKARTEDLTSRLRDSQHNPAGPSDAGAIQLETSSPFSGVPPTITELRPGEIIPRVDSPPPPYTEKEKELSELRNQMIQLQKEREMLIEEIKQKGFDTGSLFLE